MAANDAHVLAARLALIDRIRAVELRLARAAQGETARMMLRDHLHSLGNAVQVLDLGSAELAKRGPDPDGLVTDIRTAAERGPRHARQASSRSPSPRHASR